MTEYLGWLYFYEFQNGPRSHDWTACKKDFAIPKVIHAATEADIRKEIKKASESQ